ncbi:hypothetical protein KHQ06_27575 [Nocardia tengchongensis]|uniref:Uncharacterized protein n=1 Tax=Nocardia tengchongensis TaxID=2055889 RepID=A0ABX8CM90_9NOCA|nr:hypothetical protein [Nocardia tengchongensis]QVI20004.1 hypothetical protein KHQ06_27575 [Nocardia tengchongensis]
MELAGDIYLRSNAYRRLSTIYGADVAVSLIGNNHYQLRDHAGNLILGEDRSTLHHVPFGSEIPAPQGSPHEQAIRAGMSRVTVGVMQGVVYTGDLTDMSAYLTTPIGSLVVQAPGTGPDPLQPGPGGERQLQLLNNFQVLDTQGRYVMGNTLTLGSPMALWPNAAVPCPQGTVPISQLPTRSQPGSAPITVADLPDPVCTSPAGVPITGFIDDQPGQAAPGTTQPDPVQRQKDINDAYSAVGTQFGLAVAVGGLIGSLAIGVPVGIVSGVNAYNTLRLQGDVARNPISAPWESAPTTEALPTGDLRTRLVTAGVSPELAAVVPDELVATVPTELAAAVSPMLTQLVPELRETPASSLM